MSHSLTLHLNGITLDNVYLQGSWEIRGQIQSPADVTIRHLQAEIEVLHCELHALRRGRRSWWRFGRRS